MQKIFRTRQFMAGNYSVSGFVGTQGSAVSLLSNVANTGTYASPNASNSITVTGASLTIGNLSAASGVLLTNYQLPTQATGTGAITPKGLQVSLTGTPSKTYDGNTNAKLTSGDYTISGFVSGQTGAITQTVGSYASPNTGNGITVTTTLSTGNYSAGSGTNLSNYQLPTGPVAGKGNILPASSSGCHPKPTCGSGGWGIGFGWGIGIGGGISLGGGTKTTSGQSGGIGIGGGIGVGGGVVLGSGSKSNNGTGGTCSTSGGDTDGGGIGIGGGVGIGGGISLGGGTKTTSGQSGGSTES
ncbi:MAG: YDG domain-containing protein, partial [Synergistaceae bacterium]